jgi:hypothetical protein
MNLSNLNACSGSPPASILTRFRAQPVTEIPADLQERRGAEHSAQIIEQS